MSALSQSRALVGCRSAAFGQARPCRKVSHAANGSKWFMRRKDSFMVEVQVGEDEPEDMAVRRFMKCVVQSGVINNLRARRTKETKVDTYKRKLQERAMARKLGIQEPTWEEFYGDDDGEPKPFEEFFVQDNEEMDIFADMQDAEVELFRDQTFFQPLPPLGGAAGDDMFDLNNYELSGKTGYGYSTDLLANAAAGQGGFNNAQ